MLKVAVRPIRVITGHQHEWAGSAMFGITTLERDEGAWSLSVISEAGWAASGGDVKPGPEEPYDRT
jgi:hypothetical protein